MASATSGWRPAAAAWTSWRSTASITRRGGRLYFTVTGDGKPLRQRRYCHSENFYTIANAEYYANTGDTVRIERARRAYEMVYNLNHSLIKDPTGLGPKTIPETRQSRASAIR